MQRQAGCEHGRVLPNGETGSIVAQRLRGQCDQAWRDMDPHIAVRRVRSALRGVKAEDTLHDFCPWQITTAVEAKHQMGKQRFKALTHLRHTAIYKSDRLRAREVWCHGATNSSGDWRGAQASVMRVYARGRRVGDPDGRTRDEHGNEGRPLVPSFLSLAPFYPTRFALWGKLDVQFLHNWVTKGR